MKIIFVDIFADLSSKLKYNLTPGSGYESNNLNVTCPSRSTKTVVTKNFFSQRMPESWNKLPLAITVKAFRSAYQKHRQTEATA